MARSMSLGSSPYNASEADVPETLRLIERNTAETVRWVKYLTLAVILLVVLTALLYV
jgi:hypothetical protein